MFLRRRRLLRGRVLRDAEHGDALAGAAGLHLREQRHRDLGADGEEPGHARHRRPRARLRHAGRDRRRQRRARRSRRRRRRRSTGREPAGARRSSSARRCAGSGTRPSRPAAADPEEQRRRWQRVDPIPRFAQALVDWGVLDSAGLEAVAADAKAEMALVRTTAEAAPLPTPESVFEDLFAPAPAG